MLQALVPTVESHALGSTYVAVAHLLTAAAFATANRTAACSGQRASGRASDLGAGSGFLLILTKTFYHKSSGLLHDLHPIQYDSDIVQYCPIL
jgi:hypothetical protein